MLNTSRHRFSLSRVNGYLFSAPVLAVTGTCATLASRAASDAALHDYLETASAYKTAAHFFTTAFALAACFVVLLIPNSPRVYAHFSGPVIYGYGALIVASGFGGAARIVWMWFNGKADWIAQCMQQRSDCEEQWVLLGAPLTAQAFLLLEVLAVTCVILGVPTYMCVVFVERMRARADKLRGSATRNGHANGIRPNGTANGYANGRND